MNSLVSLAVVVAILGGSIGTRSGRRGTSRAAGEPARARPVGASGRAHAQSRGARSTSSSAASRLPGAGRWSYDPAHARRQRHQDRLGAPAGLQAEDRAAVVDEVELDVAAAPDLLPAPLGLAVGQVPPPLDDRQVRRRGRRAPRRRARSASVALEVAPRGPRRRCPPTPRCSPRWRQVEVLVAPPACSGRSCPARAARRRRGGRGGSGAVLLEQVVRGEVGAAAEPGRAAAPDEPDVRVRGRHSGLQRVDDQREPGRGEGGPSPGSLAASEVAAASPSTSREVHARLLEDGAVLRARARRRRRRRAAPRGRVEKRAAPSTPLERRADLLLQGLHGGGHRGAEPFERLGIRRGGHPGKRARGRRWMHLPRGACLSSGEHHRLVPVDDDPVLAVPADRAGEHAPLEVATEVLQVLDGVAVGDPATSCSMIGPASSSP